jgi:two-component system, OmpR family, sensor histidine kinase KdpD
MARIEAAELGLRRRWGPIDEMVSAAIVRAEPVTQRHFVRINIEKELPVVRVDERAVSEVVYTLVDGPANSNRSAARSSGLSPSASRSSPRNTEHLHCCSRRC